MDQQTIAYGLTWVGTAAWVLCFWWMHRISTRQDALLTELRDLAQTQQDILREVHPDVGEIKEHVVEEQGAQINAIAEQVTQVANTVASPKTNAPYALDEAAAGGRRGHTPPVSLLTQVAPETVAPQDQHMRYRGFPSQRSNKRRSVREPRKSGKKTKGYFFVHTYGGRKLLLLSTCTAVFRP